MLNEDRCKPKSMWSHTMPEYRFYHCYQTPAAVICHPVDNEKVLPSEPNSRLLFVPTYIPNVLDSLVLTYKCYQDVQIRIIHTNGRRTKNGQ
jgi:hypothetical protein